MVNIGDTYGGGRIFYINQEGGYGLVATVQDNNRATTWYAAIQAVKDCRDGGFMDWYLPSMKELALLHQQEPVFGNFEYGTGYWSGTENANTLFAEMQVFGMDMVITGDKGAPRGNVRPVRRFMIESEPVVTIVQPAIQADFSISMDTDVAPATVRFTNLSKGAESYEWAFGAGLNMSKEVSSSYTYTKAGTYDVTLAAIGSGGRGVDRQTKTIVIKELVLPAPKADFVISPVSGVAPLSVTFENRAQNAQSSSWFWGDGGSANQGFTHTYVKEGNYTFSLSVIGLDGKTYDKKEQVVVVSAKPAVVEQPQTTQPQTQPRSDQNIWWIIGAVVAVWLLRR